MPFQPGQSGNLAGRPPGIASGRARALLTLDKMLSRESNQERLDMAFQQNFDRDPVRFFRQIIMPLVPQTALVALQAQVQRAPWRSLTEVCEENDRLRTELAAVVADYPGQQEKILGLMADGIPVSALRIQLGRPPAALPATAGRKP